MSQFKRCLIMVLFVFSYNSFAAVKLDFGIVLKNQAGEPIGFELTNTIPIQKKGQPSLYGVVISSTNDQEIIVASVHKTPTAIEGQHNKFLGKPMKVVNRGGIFMKTQVTDLAGEYEIELYFDHTHYQTIRYTLVNPNNDS